MRGRVCRQWLRLCRSSRFQPACLRMRRTWRRSLTQSCAGRSRAGQITRLRSACHLCKLRRLRPHRMRQHSQLELKADCMWPGLLQLLELKADKKLQAVAATHPRIVSRVHGVVVVADPHLHTQPCGSRHVLVEGSALLQPTTCTLERIHAASMRSGRTNSLRHGHRSI